MVIMLGHVVCCSFKMVGVPPLTGIRLRTPVVEAPVTLFSIKYNDLRKIGISAT